MKNDFEHNLIKGRIAEMVFDLMMRESGAFTVIPFGYENTVHELLHYRKDIKQQKKAINRVRKTPDFVVISDVTKTVHLVEVKYRKNPDWEEINDRAEEMTELWDPSWLFLATPDEFYFNPADQIIKNKGKMNPINIESITPEIKEKYLELLNDFEGNFNK